MTLRERLTKLVNNGGFNILPEFRIVEERKGISVQSIYKDIWEVVFEDESNEFKGSFFDGRIAIITEDMISTAESVNEVCVGIVLHHRGDCLGNAYHDCECPVCTGVGYISDVEFRYVNPCLFTELNKEIYEDLKDMLKAESNDSVIISLKDKYNDLVSKPLDRTMKIVAIESYPFSKMIYSSERTREFEKFCNPSQDYNEEEFIKHAFMLAYGRVRSIG